MSQWSTPRLEPIEFDLSPIDLEPHWYNPKKKRRFVFEAFSPNLNLERNPHAFFAMWRGECIICDKAFYVYTLPQNRESTKFQTVTCRDHRRVFGWNSARANKSTGKNGAPLSRSTIANRRTKARRRVRETIAKRDQLKSE